MMTTTTTQTERDWAAIHGAAAAVDQARRSAPGGGALGSDGLGDAWGGTYRPEGYESRGLAGLVTLTGGADAIRAATWSAIHRASTDVASAAALRDGDSPSRWVSDGRRGVQYHATHRGAAWRATRHGGSVSRGYDPADASLRVSAAWRRREAALGRARAAVRTALALDALYRLLAAAGVVEYDPQTTICGATDTLQVTGLRWLAGAATETAPVSVRAALAFAAGGPAEAMLAGDALARDLTDDERGQGGR